MTTTPISFYCTAISASTLTRSHDFGSRFQVFAAGENLFDRAIEVSKTPSTTLATPRVARVGFQINLRGGR